MDKSWNDAEDDEEFSDEEKPKQNKIKETKRPNKQKFAEIMKADDAFPTLGENDFVDEESDE